MKQITVRLTDDEHATLTSVASTVSMTASGYVAAMVREDAQNTIEGLSCYAIELQERTAAANAKRRSQRVMPLPVSTDDQDYIEDDDL